MNTTCTCGTCIFWHRMESGGVTHEGECRKRTAVYVQDLIDVWPCTSESAGCGQHERDFTKEYDTKG